MVSQYAAKDEKLHLLGPGLQSRHSLVTLNDFKILLIVLMISSFKHKMTALNLIILFNKINL